MKIKASLPGIFFIWILFLFATNPSQAQKKPSLQNPTSRFTVDMKGERFGAASDFIENIGQYGLQTKGHEGMGKILYGYEGLEMPILFTSKGLIHLHRKVNHLSHEEGEKLKGKGLGEEEIESKVTTIDRTITMEWVDANPDPEIIADGVTQGYHTYGLLAGKARGFAQITYKELYPDIDVVYFLSSRKAGFEYTIIVRPGGDVSKIKMKYGGDIKTLKRGRDGSIIVYSDINGIIETLPVCYYEQNAATNKNDNFKRTGDPLSIKYTLSRTEINFTFPHGYARNRRLIIDPFVSNTNNLTGSNSGKAKDIDFDYMGNLFVTGGGSFFPNHQLIKYDAKGVPQWFFSGALFTPSWQFGPYYGGWVVDKASGKVYLGQGAPGSGFKIIRLDASGNYDNFITTANNSFNECWKLLWNCNNGVPQIIVAGGSSSSSINLGVFSPPAVTLSALNLTGITSTNYQDISDIVIDPRNYQMYCIFSSLVGTPFVNNRIYKFNAPYSASTMQWNVLSGYSVLTEINNRPYLGLFGSENSINTFSVNSAYLFYWDGLNLKAFNKVTGSAAGTPLAFPGNTALMQGGIVADECNNIFVGSINGTIKVFKFDGKVFNDAAAPDITIPGFSTNSTYDLAYDNAKHLLYACGNGFVASFDISSYCADNIYKVVVSADCSLLSAQASLSPQPPAGSVVTYTLYNGSVPLNSNNTGTFTGLSTSIPYTVKAIIDQNCSGTEAVKDFTIALPVVALVKTDAVCQSDDTNGSITANVSGGTAPFQYSLDGQSFQASNVFMEVPQGPHTISIKDANGCTASASLRVNRDCPLLGYGNTVDAVCGHSGGELIALAIGGTAPYTYSDDGINFQSSYTFVGYPAGNYTVIIKDAAGLTVSVDFAVKNISLVQLSATQVDANCNLSNGSVTLQASGGRPPYQYTIDNNTYQSANTFSGLAANTYYLEAFDADRCPASGTVIIANKFPSFTTTKTDEDCLGKNGSITFTGTAGVVPFQYSIDGVNFQGTNTFTSLPAGIYNKLAVKDATGCAVTGSESILNNSSLGFLVNVYDEQCPGDDGRIEITSAKGVSPFTYSLGGIAFQTDNNFYHLKEGTYTIYVKDASGCLGNKDFVIKRNCVVSLSLNTSDAMCGKNSGSITVLFSGGAQPYSYSIDGINFQASNFFSGLPASSYAIIVKDATGAINKTDAIINGTQAPLLKTSYINANCSKNNGYIEVEGMNGLAPFQYSLNGGAFQNSNTFTDLAGGKYTVTIKDANGCTNNEDVSIQTIPPPQLSVIPISSTCLNNDGAVIANVSGGRAPFLYHLNDNTQSDNTFKGLSAGKYVIEVQDNDNCVVQQPDVLIDMINNLSFTKGNDQTICEGSPAQLSVSSNATSFSWTPTQFLSSSTVPNPVARPVSTTQFSVTATLGICEERGIIAVSVFPAPVAKAGKDTAICYGQNLHLKGSGGASYLWQPSTFLDHPNISDPVSVKPTGTITYSLTVVDNNGCKSSRPDQIIITVVTSAAKVFAGNDTSVFINEPFALHALDVSNSGFTNYTWSPPFGLSNTFIPDPIAVLNQDFTYKVTARTVAGCEASDEIMIKVFRESEIYVPTAFTPDGDGKNDILKAFPVGIKQFIRFSIFDRWGQSVFTTSDPGNGWPGTIEGKKQGTNVFIWIAEGIDYKGNKIFRKGTVVLIR